ncbi:MAG: chorismate-binding protein, partial [Myxococcales bacterium]|nr:chorismate-binding protein [Myxococcales bacterium]
MRGASIAQRDVLRGLERAEAFVRRAHDAGARVVTVAAPRARDVAALWDDAQDALLWHPAAAPAVAGLGLAAELAPGDAEGGAIGDALALSRPEQREAGVEAPALAAFGGFAFDATAAPAAPWGAFGVGLFVLPRWSYGIGPEGAWLRVVVGEGDRLGGVLDELRAIWARLESDPPPPATPRIVRRDDAPEEAWCAYVTALTDAITRGEAVKVVAAQAARLRLEREPSPRAVLEALRRRFPGCTRFALRRAGTTFLGATPERLV